MSRFQVYKKGTSEQLIVKCVGILSAALAIGTTVFIFVTIGNWQQYTSHQNPPGDILKMLMALTAVWAIAPPVWFWIEYWWLFRAQDHSDGSALEYFKTGQDNSKAVWAAFVLVLGALLTSLANATSSC